MDRRCCKNCFSDPELQRLATSAEVVSVGECEYCGAPEAKLVDCGAFTELFREAAGFFYVRFDAIPHHWSEAVGIDVLDGECLGDLLNQDFGGFSGKVDAAGLVAAALDADTEWGELGFDDTDEVWFDADAHPGHSTHDDYIVENLRTLRAAVSIFGLSLDSARPSGVGSSEEVAKAHAHILRTLVAGAKTLPAGSRSLFRARVESGDELESTNDVLPPPAHLAGSGRANHVGQRALYLASSVETAIAEVRPALRDRVAVAEFEVCRELHFADLGPLALDPKTFWAGPKKYWLVLREQEVRRTLAREFAQPFRPHDTAVEYLFTQQIANMLRAVDDIDGIVFPSAQHSGDAYVIFDPDAAKPTAATLTRYEIQHIGERTLKQL